MKRIILPLMIFCSSFLYGQKKDYPIQAVSFTQVNLSDNFWLPRIEMNRVNGVTVLKGKVPAYIIENNERINTIEQSFTAIPYYSWANRGKGEMILWFPTKVEAIELLANKTK